MLKKLTALLLCLTLVCAAASALALTVPETITVTWSEGEALPCVTSSSVSSDGNTITLMLAAPLTDYDLELDGESLSYYDDDDGERWTLPVTVGEAPETSDGFAAYVSEDGMRVTVMSGGLETQLLSLVAWSRDETVSLEFDLTFSGTGSFRIAGLQECVEDWCTVTAYHSGENGSVSTTWKAPDRLSNVYWSQSEEVNNRYTGVSVSFSNIRTDEQSVRCVYHLYNTTNGGFTLMDSAVYEGDQWLSYDSKGKSKKCGMPKVFTAVPELVIE